MTTTSPAEVGRAATRTLSAPRSETPVALLVSRFPAVTETFILREVIEMQRQGQPIRLVTMIRDTPPVVHDAAKPWLDKTLYAKFFSGPVLTANLRALVRTPLKYLSTLARILAGTITSPEVFIKTVALFPKSVYLAGVLQREGIRHLHAHWASYTGTMALIIGTFSNITFSLTVHAHDIQIPSLRKLLRWKIRESRFVRCCTEFNKRFLEELYPAEARGKMIVVHYGIEPELYAGDHSALAPARPRIVCVGQYKPYKGLPYLIEACRILRDAGLEFDCDLIGHGPMHGELSRLIHDANLESSVHLLGARSEEEVTRRLREASLFVLPSVIEKSGQMEGMPNALIEAMAAGKAVISTTTSGIPELIDHGQNGLLVPPFDPQALADAMRILITDPQRARRMGEDGRAKVRREYDLRDVAAQLRARIDRENVA